MTLEISVVPVHSWYIVAQIFMHKILPTPKEIYSLDPGDSVWLRVLCYLPIKRVLKKYIHWDVDLLKAVFPRTVTWEESHSKHKFLKINICIIHDVCKMTCGYLHWFHILPSTNIHVQIYLQNKKKQTSNDNYKINKYYSIYILYIYKTTNSI